MWSDDPVEETEVEFVVVGGGLLGLAAGRALARRGKETVVLEQAAVGHARSGSKGTSRIFRYGYEDPFYVRLAMAAEPLWTELESESGEPLLVRTGQLDFGAGLEDLVAALRSCRAPVRVVTAREVERRFSSMAPRDAVEEPASGVLLADRCLAALRRGLEVREGRDVTRIGDDEGAVHVLVRREDGEDERYRASVAVVCAGARTGGIVGSTQMPEQASTLEQVAYVRLDEDLPVVIDRSGGLLYGLPDPTRGSYKVGLHHSGPLADPRTTGTEDDSELLDRLAAATRATVPGWSGAMVGAERCLYDTTATEDFVLDRIGRVVVGCGTSGHGFKFGPLLGELLADLAITGVLPGELGRFRLSR